MKFAYTADRNIRADRLLNRELPFLGRSLAQRLFRDKEIKIDGKAVKADTEITNGTQVTVFLPDPHRKLRKLIGCAIIHEDDEIIAIDKSPRITSVPGVGTGGASLLEALEKLLQIKLIPVHRLDRGTSGVIIFAKTEKMAQRLIAAFRARCAEKTYTALVAKTPCGNTGVIREPLRRVGERVIVDPAGHSAETQWEVVERRADGSTLITCRPVTGRTHQIRVHLAHINCPIIGDDTYGGKQADRLMLHATRLKILNYELAADIPKEMRK